MFQSKNGWYADWRDAQGTRIRKLFPSKAAAERHERKMKAEAASKKAQRRKVPPPNSSRRKLKPGTAQAAKLRAHSLPTLVGSHLRK